MSETSEAEAVADEGVSPGDMQSNSDDGSTDIFNCTMPSTAASTTETIDSSEEVHNCDEWELFLDTDQRDASGDEVSVDDPSDEEIDPMASKCVDTDLRLTPAQLGNESTFVLGRSRQDNTDRQDSTSRSDEPGLQAMPCTSDRIGDKKLVGDPVAEEERPIFRSEPSAHAEEERPISRNEPSADTSIRRRIHVVVRVRPHLDNEGMVVVTAGATEGTSLCVQTTTSQGSISTVTECAFDRVFMGGATQENVFAAIEPSVQTCLEGYNATVFAYGQTGTGKTHTLFGRGLGASNDNTTCEGAIEQESDSPRMAKSSWGIVPRTLSYLLDQAAILKQKDCQVELHLSFLQIYNDRLFDLLTDRMRQKPLLIREQPTLDGTMSVTVQGLSSERITSFSNAMRIIHQAHTNRSVRETESNSSSSRSHAIVQLHVTTQCPAASGLRKARLNLVDLAGSEKWNTDLEMEDSHSQELKNINSSLSALGNCIAALTEAGRKHIPYRDSTLTRVLQDSFGGNTQSCLIATVNATQQCCDETIRTLQFADRARSVMQTTRVNEVADGSTELLMAKLQIVKLRERLESEQRRRHETRLKEHQTLQREFQDKLKGKDKEITTLARDNAVFQKWREEDVQKIRALESRVKDLERQIDLNDRNHETLTDSATSNLAQLPRRQNATPASISMAKPTGVQRTRSRTNLVRVGSDNSTAAGTYKQVLERYALGSNKGQQLKATQNTKVAFDQTKANDPTYDATNQLVDQPPGLDTNSPMKSKPQWETGTDDSQACGSHDARSTVTRYPSSGVCVSPVACPPNAAAAVPSSTKNSWVYSNSAASMASFNSELTSSALSKSTPAIITQKRESNDKRHEPWSPNPASTSAWKQEPLNNAGSLSYSFLPRPSAINGSTIEPCQKHKLAGCMLCSVNESFQSIQAAPIRQPNTIVSPMTKPNEPPRKTQDGPCERHQLLRCFICSKGGLSSSSDVQVATTSSTLTCPSSMYSYNTAASTVRGSNLSYRSPLPSEVQSKCALHALANCILCAGVKAMTRKVAIPTPQASPAKSAAMFDVRSGDARADDRYRRYTLDERILNCETRAKQVTYEW